MSLSLLPVVWSLQIGHPIVNYFYSVDAPARHELLQETIWETDSKWKPNTINVRFSVRMEGFAKDFERNFASISFWWREKKQRMPNCCKVALFITQRFIVVCNSCLIQNWTSQTTPKKGLLALKAVSYEGFRQEGYFPFPSFVNREHLLLEVKHNCRAFVTLHDIIS